MSLSQDIDALLPQTQCGLCGYAGCRPYAEAMAAGAATIDRCPPGGVPTLRALGQLLSIDSQPYEAKVFADTRMSAVAEIREAECIGCTKCIQACPVDAIVGAAKFMHTVLPQECTGCGLCVEPCPVDCIDILPLDLPEGTLSYDRDLARKHYMAKQVRLLNEEQLKSQQYRAKRRLAVDTEDVQADKQAKNDYILAALARAKRTADGS